MSTKFTKQSLDFTHLTYAKAFELVKSARVLKNLPTLFTNAQLSAISSHNISYFLSNNFITVHHSETQPIYLKVNYDFYRGTEVIPEMNETLYNMLPEVFKNQIEKQERKINYYTVNTEQIAKLELFVSLMGEIMHCFTC